MPNYYLCKTIDSTIIWTVSNKNHKGQISYNKYKIDGDTIINDNKYLKLYYSDRYKGKTYWKYECAIRDSSGFWYFLPKWDWDKENPEYLLYNFNVRKGDTVNINNYWTSKKSTLVVYSIDSLKIGDELKKRIGLGLPDDGIWEYWIDGIGSDQGLLYSGNNTFSEYNRLTFIESEKGYNYIFHIEQENEVLYDFKIVETQAEYRIKIDGWSEEQKMYFELYKLSGQLKYKSEIIGGYISIPKLNLWPGRYQYRIISDSEKDRYGKITIN